MTELVQINEEWRDKAINYLAKTDSEAAVKKSWMIGLQSREKTILSIERLKHEGTVQDKDDKARTSEAYKKWLDDYENAVAEYELVKNKRLKAQLIIECWRSENANRRMAGGNL